MVKAGCFFRNWASSVACPNFAPEARGHGVPEAMDAIYYKGGIRPVVALIKSVASAIAIGSGASVGRAALASFAGGRPPNSSRK